MESTGVKQSGFSSSKKLYPDWSLRIRLELLFRNFLNWWRRMALIPREKNPMIKQTAAKPKNKYFLASESAFGFS